MPLKPGMIESLKLDGIHKHLIEFVQTDLSLNTF